MAPASTMRVQFLMRLAKCSMAGVVRAHETAKEDPLEASGVQPVAETQLTLINGGNGHGKEALEDDRSFVSQADAPPCSDCGAIMVRRGACYSCINCGATSGCA